MFSALKKWICLYFNANLLIPSLQFGVGKTHTHLHAACFQEANIANMVTAQAWAEAEWVAMATWVGAVMGPTWVGAWVAMRVAWARAWPPTVEWAAMLALAPAAASQPAAAMALAALAATGLVGAAMAVLMGATLAVVVVTDDRRAAAAAEAAVTGRTEV
jgi:hypothetical protein